MLVMPIFKSIKKILLKATYNKSLEICENGEGIK